MPSFLREAVGDEPTLTSCPKCGQRLTVDWSLVTYTVRSPRDIADRLVASMGGLEREELRVVLLSAKNRVIDTVTVYMGNVSGSLVRVGELFTEAIRRNAVAIVIVHNHPSGDPTPSPDDLSLTGKVVEAGRLLDIAVLDHIVIGHGAYVSLRDRGVAFDTPR